MRVKLRQEEEVLASGETPPKSSLLEMVRELISKGKDGGPIMMQEEQSRIETIGHHVLLGQLYQYHCFSLSCCGT